MRIVVTGSAGFSGRALGPVLTARGQEVVALGRAAADMGAHMLFMSSVKVHGEMTTDHDFDESSRFVPQHACGRPKADAAGSAGRRRHAYP